MIATGPLSKVYREVVLICWGGQNSFGGEKNICGLNGCYHNSPGDISWSLRFSHQHNLHIFVVVLSSAINSGGKKQH